MLNQKISIIILICLKIIPFQYVAQDKHNSFSVDLIHINSPLSPFYNKSMSRSELLARDVQRSHARVKRLNLHSSSINEKYMVSEMTGTGNNYLMGYLLGSEKFLVSAFVSMATNFIWTISNKKQDDQDARPFGSTTYLDVPSDSDICMKFYFRDEGSISPNCVYDYLGISRGRYRSKGVVGTDNYRLSMTHLEKGLYGKIAKLISELFATEPTRDFPLCFEDSKPNRVLLPSMVFHFEDADIQLKPSNVFVNNGQGKLCLAIFLEEFGPSIFGSQAQVDHVWQFDLENNLVYFTKDPLDCKSVKL